MSPLLLCFQYEYIHSTYSVFSLHLLAYIKSLTYHQNKKRFNSHFSNRIELSAAQPHNSIISGPTLCIQMIIPSICYSMCVCVYVQRRIGWQNICKRCNKIFYFVQCLRVFPFTMASSNGIFVEYFYHYSFILSISLLCHRRSIHLTMHKIK